MTPTPTIRSADSDDVPRLLPLVLQYLTSLGITLPPVDHLESLTRQFLSDDKSTVIVVEHEDALAGFLVATVQGDQVSSEQIVVVVARWLAPDIRTRDLSLELLGHAELFGLKAGAARVLAASDDALNELDFHWRYASSTYVRELSTPATRRDHVRRLDTGTPDAGDVPWVAPELGQA